MSNILVQNIKHTNNTTAVEINTSAQMTVKGEGSATTNLQQGLCKMWCLASMADNSIYDSFNTSSIDDDATGQLGFNYTNHMRATGTYAPQVSGVVADSTGFNDAGTAAILSDQVTMQASDTNGSGYDMNPFSVTVHGDLA